MREEPATILKLAMAKALPNSPLQDARRSETVGDFVLSEIVYPPSFQIGWHSHELAAFALTVSGSTCEAFSGARVDHTEGGVLVRPAGERHRDSIGTRGAKCFLIEFRNNWMEDIPKFRSVLQRPWFHASGAVTNLLQRAYCEWLEGDTASGIAVQAIAMETAVLLTRHLERSSCERPPLWLSRVKRRLDDAFADPPCLLEMARESGVHPATLARQFRRHFGDSIGEHLRKRRLEAARQLLIKTDVPLVHVALAAGFSNHPHFSTTFKQFTGYSPREFRRLNR